MERNRAPPPRSRIRPPARDFPGRAGPEIRGRGPALRIRDFPGRAGPGGRPNFAHFGGDLITLPFGTEILEKTFFRQRALFGPLEISRFFGIFWEIRDSGENSGKFPPAPGSAGPPISGDFRADFRARFPVFWTPPPTPAGTARPRISRPGRTTTTGEISEIRGATCRARGAERHPVGAGQTHGGSDHRR